MAFGLRLAGFWGLWVVIAGIDPLGLAIGAGAALGATLASLSLMPPGPWRLHPLALVVLVVRFLAQSLVAGVDVARRAFDPRLPLRPGFVVWRCGLAEGTATEGFLTLSSLLPGTLPAGRDASGAVLIHCLDTSDDAAAAFTAEQARFARAFGQATDRG